MGLHLKETQYSYTYKIANIEANMVSIERYTPTLRE